MGRSVSYPRGAQIAFRLLDDDEPDDAEWAYECLCDEIRLSASATFPSFDPVDGWRNCGSRTIRDAPTAITSAAAIASHTY